MTSKGNFTANEDTKYQVEHYLEKLDGTYELKDTEEKKGTTDTEAIAKAKTCTGFTFDATVKGTKQSGTIYRRWQVSPETVLHKKQLQSDVYEHTQLFGRSKCAACQVQQRIQVR